MGNFVWNFWNLGFNANPRFFFALLKPERPDSLH